MDYGRWTWKQMLQKFIVHSPWSIVLLCLLGCGSGDNPSQPITFSESPGSAGYLHLSLSNTESPHRSEVGTITQYKMRVEGDGFEPIEETISKEASGVLIQNIPQGTDRRIQVQALNRYGQLLREGSIENVVVESGVQKNLEVKMESVPVLLNLHEGKYLSNQRFYFHVLTDPNHRVAVSGESALSDIVSGRDFIDVSADGSGKFCPGVLNGGDYVFEVIDQDSKKSSKISLHLWDGSGVKGAPLFSASAQDKKLGDVFEGRQIW